jgi:hypothetical protein
MTPIINRQNFGDMTILVSRQTESFHANCALGREGTLRSEIAGAKAQTHVRCVALLPRVLPLKRQEANVNKLPRFIPATSSHQGTIGPSVRYRNNPAAVDDYTVEDARLNFASSLIKAFIAKVYVLRHSLHPNTGAGRLLDRHFSSRPL